jgi:hypothetical protein
MRIKYSFKAVENFLKKYAGEYKIMSDGEIAINSPFVGDTTFDCRISIDKQCFHDFESDESGNIEKLAAALADTNVEGARKLLLSFGAGDLVSKPDIPKEPEVIETKKISMPPGAFSFEPDEKRGTLFNSQMAKRFLVEKMVDYKMARKYDLRWTEVSFIKVKTNPLRKMNLSHRIIIPSYEEGNLVYYQARDYSGKSEMRYKNPTKEIQRKGIIVPFYDLLFENEILFISEGPWEAIQYGGTYMLGPVLSDRQIYKIKQKNPKAIYLVPDNDETARRKLVRNVKYLKSWMDCPVYVVKWWKGEYAKFKDPIDAKITFDELLNADFIEADRNIELRIRLGNL